MFIIPTDACTGTATQDANYVADKSMFGAFALSVCKVPPFQHKSNNFSCWLSPILIVISCFLQILNSWVPSRWKHKHHSDKLYMLTYICEGGNTQSEITISKSLTWVEQDFMEKPSLSLQHKTFLISKRCPCPLCPLRKKRWQHSGSILRMAAQQQGSFAHECPYVCDVFLLRVVHFHTTKACTSRDSC